MKTRNLLEHNLCAPEFYNIALSSPNHKRALEALVALVQSMQSLDCVVLVHWDADTAQLYFSSHPENMELAR